MRIDFILNEMLKKVDYASIWVETIELGKLDADSVTICRKKH